MQHTPVLVDEVDETCPQPADALICKLAHDLRQPLSVIQNAAAYLEMVLASSVPAATCQARMIGRQVEEMDCMLAESVAALRQLLVQGALAGSGVSRERTKSMTAGVT
jgi:hypothetical protein